jgi:hypothetical protein
MEANQNIESKTIEAVDKVAPVLAAAAPASFAPFLSLLPTVFPFIARNARRHPVKAAAFSAALLLLAVAQNRRNRQSLSRRPVRAE